MDPVFAFEDDPTFPMGPTGGRYIGPFNSLEHAKRTVEAGLADHIYLAARSGDRVIVIERGQRDGAGAWKWTPQQEA